MTPPPEPPPLPNDGSLDSVAAGGVVWRRTAEGPRVAVVYRSQHADFTLPKGKLEEGDGGDLATCAVREVEEETGWRARRRAFLAVTRHGTDGGTKGVWWWRMSALQKVGTPDPREIGHVLWLTADEAIERLDYANERELIVMEKARRGRKAGVRRFFPGSWQSPETARLAAAIESFRGEVEAWREGPVGPAGREDPSVQPRVGVRVRVEDGWKVAAVDLLDRVDEAFEEGHREVAWRCLAAARRMALYALDPEEVEARSIALREEARDKLRGWRKRSVLSVLGEGPDLASPPGAGETVVRFEGGRREPLGWPPSVDALYHATQLRDEHFNNMWYAMVLRAGSLSFLASALVAELAFLLFEADASWFASGDAAADAGEGLVWPVLLFGMLGGTFSAIQSITSDSTEKRIPSVVSHSVLAVLRPALGAAGALFLYLVLASGVVNFGTPSPALYLAAAFAAGFSERVILRAMGPFTGTGDAGKD